MPRTALFVIDIQNELAGNPQTEVPGAARIQNTFESNPDLADKLKDAGVDHIVAFGLQSEYCVGETCKGALAAGFQVSLLQGAHSTYDGEDRTASVIEREIEEMLVSRGAKLVPWESAVSHWKTAGVVC
ncbi:hypothetical protein LLEC1_02385 [Akanthomyces lecanii]|uniref:Isochorismatase-like domain-containing protein n=1 Tax=Cordyceps confragosa TaxID=2714763 RepID=A0A179IKA6_CORDF|nr:hypothetical protein LLEC1_02385 [Akanthomyces lecanii]